MGPFASPFLVFFFSFFFFFFKRVFAHSLLDGTPRQVRRRCNAVLSRTHIILQIRYAFWSAIMAQAPDKVLHSLINRTDSHFLFAWQSNEKYVKYYDPTYRDMQWNGPYRRPPHPRERHRCDYHLEDFFQVRTPAHHRSVDCFAYNSYCYDVYCSRYLIRRHR
jgi:hypothetical protein